MNKGENNVASVGQEHSCWLKKIQYLTPKDDMVFYLALKKFHPYMTLFFVCPN
jgi:hypothetical protein